MNKRRLVLALIAIMMVSFGISFTLKANIGVGAIDGLLQSMND